ncbi:MAG: FHA domain-containing protein [Planctomycetia bacterium]|nr:FHA domain-containing protein [Planctomycetia bacterium]
MKASLEVLIADRVVRRIELREGQVVQFGRTDWADFSFRDDAAMADVHFAIECRHDACRLKALVTDRDTLVNGEKVEEAVLHTADRISAGLSTFLVTIEGEAAPLGAIVAGAAIAATPPATDFVNLCRYLGLDEALPFAETKPHQSRDELLQALIAAQQYSAAARLYAHWLPKPAAVWWGCLCVRESCGNALPKPQESAWEAAKNWVGKQDEATRREAENALEMAAYSGPGGMLASAAFATGGSIAPAGLEDLPPDPRMTGHAVRTALIFASVFGDARQAPARWRWFLVLAAEVTAGKITLPEAR